MTVQLSARFECDWCGRVEERHEAPGSFEGDFRPGGWCAWLHTRPYAIPDNVRYLRPIPDYDLLFCNMGCLAAWALVTVDPVNADGGTVTIDPLAFQFDAVMNGVPVEGPTRPVTLPSRSRLLRLAGWAQARRARLVR